MKQGARGSFWLTAALTLGAGLWLGAWSNKEWGFLVGGALGYLIAQRLHLGAQVAALRQRLAELETARPGAAPAEPTERPAP
ncbi:MAG: hypothetical protein ACREO3_02775, partial [Arenimonas sp.]